MNNMSDLTPEQMLVIKHAKIEKITFQNYYVEPGDDAPMILIRVLVEKGYLKQIAMVERFWLTDKGKALHEGLNHCKMN